MIQNYPLRYALLLALTYALLFWLGNGNHDDVSYWNDEAAPYLGEAPAGMTAEIVRATTSEELPCVIYHLPANEAMQQKIITTLRLKKEMGWSKPSTPVATYYGSWGIYCGDSSILGSGVLTPRLDILSDGSMRLIIDDTNAHDDPSMADYIPTPHPEYLPNKVLEFCRHAMLAIVCFMLPGLFCSIGWLWIQRRPIRSGDCFTICLLIPAIIACVGAYADFHIHGFSKGYIQLCSVASALSNILTALFIIGLTAIVKALYRYINQNKS